MTQPDPQPAPGQVWLSRYTTGMHVAVTETDGSRARIVPVTVTDGTVTVLPGRGRWSTAAQLHRAYRLTDHVLRSAR
ncbi:hypothetical protein GTY41_03580 [Streptomyces sp. SID685]|uniref:hypothetical protein n=1 Tax=Streptomyces sp. SID685 TaxID=2690322 RepID=UPI00136C6F49|nr:hypothetical protein [Streptomyces sp. SID685]MYR84046.1 hypothetical protein [Streptomyces sp. SID685]